MSEGILRIASAQYQVGFLENWQQYRTKIHEWVEGACRQGARLLLFPEYFSMELASIFGREVYSSLDRQLAEMQNLLPDFLNLYAELARSHGLHIVAGSFPVRVDDGSYRNRSYLLRPDGSHDFQEKLVMTRFENEQWFIHAGCEAKVFDTDWGRIGIEICYDSEFPLIARKQVEAGANLILVPSCTDTLAGYHRVRIGCQARALENQCYVVQSPTVGTAPWSESIDVNIGAAGIYTPVDYGFPADGILAKGELNAPQWVVAELDLSAIETIRHTGQVFNYRDWPVQFQVC